MNDIHTDRRLKVFLCHGSEDKPTVRKIYFALREDGINPWLDEMDILPGQNWDAEIKRAVKLSDAILVCLSSKSVRKEGYLQKEIKFALDVADEKPDGTIFIIPIKLDECELPQRLQHWQYTKWWKPEAYKWVLRSLRARAVECGLEYVPGDDNPNRSIPPIETASGRILYKTTNVQELARKNYDGLLFKEDAAKLSSDTVIAVTREALDNLLKPFQNDERREAEKENLLGLMGIHQPYREWQEANTKNYCFRNEDNELDVIINHTRVQSSNITSIGYDSPSQTLEIVFNSGSVYQYYNISENLFENLRDAPSHGKFLNEYIKTAEYPYRQIK